MLLVVFGLAVVGGAAPSRAGAFPPPQNALWFGETAEPSATVGPNGLITASGSVVGVTGCPTGGVDDYFETTSDVYIVDAGSEAAGGKLVEAGGGVPATIIGVLDAFVDEPLGVTGPQGSIGEGTYDVVFDACQDGIFQPGTDSVHAGVLTVAFPPVLPPYNSFIGDLKAKAFAQAKFWVQTGQLIQVLRILDAASGLGDAQSMAETALSMMVDNVVQKANGVSFANPIRVALDGTANEVKHYLAIAADPPDADYKQPVALPPITTAPASSPLPVQAATGALAMPEATENALSAALLQALERYQGARMAADAGWTLAHAREIRSLATALAAAQQRTAAAAAGLSGSLTGTSYDAVAKAVGDLADQFGSSGFTATQRQELENLGLTPTQLAALPQQVRAEIFGFDNAYTDNLAAAQQTLSGLAGAERDAAASSTALAGRMEDVIAGLTAQHSVPQTAPAADAGGPYTATAGTPITLDASGSQPGEGESIASYAWDTDGDGAFDDATGATPSVTFGANAPGLVGVKTTGSDGQTAIAYTSVDLDRGSAPTITSRSPDSRLATVTVGKPATFSVATSGGDAGWTLDGTTVGTGATLQLDAQPGQIGPHHLQATLTGAAGPTTSVDWYLRVLAPDADGDGWTATPDCNDHDALVSPGRTEVVGNGLDDDCDPGTSDTPLDAVPGAAVSWGSGSDADATSLGRDVATDTPAGTAYGIRGLDRIRQVAAGDRMGLALTASGAVWAWGRGTNGQLGTGSTTDQRTPKAVVDPSRTGQLGVVGPKAIGVTSNGQSAALLGDGTVAAWGENANGALGTGSSAAGSSVPRLVRDSSGTLKGVTHIAAGGSFLALVTGGGDLYVTGGVCGTAAGTGAATVAGLPGKVASIAAGSGHLLILLADGSLYGCGANDHGQLGGTPGGAVAAPRQIDLPSKAGVPSRLAAGDGTSAVLDAGGALWTFGRNDHGQLGTGGSGPDQPTPVRAALPDGPAITALGAGAAGMAAARADGTLLLWGNGTATPTRAKLPDGMLIDQIALGVTGTLRYATVTRSYATLAWGYDWNNAAGPGMPVAIEQPTLTQLPALRDVDENGGASVGIGVDGRVWSWGASAWLGAGEDYGAPSRAAPGPVLGIGGAPGSQLRARATVSSTDQGPLGVLLDGGEVALWGYTGDYGDGGDQKPRPYPVLVLDPSGTEPLTGATQVSMSMDTGLILLDDGAVDGFGSPSGLCREDPATDLGDYPVPIRLDDVGGDVKSVLITDVTGLFLKRDGSLWSCSDAHQPALGRDATPASGRTPGQVEGMGPGEVLQIARAGSGALALKSDGTVWAWGVDQGCQLGCKPDLSDEFTWRKLPQQLALPPGPPVVSLWSDFTAAFAVRADGSVLGWGWNNANALGLPDTVRTVAQPTVIPMPGNRPVWKIAGADNGGERALALALVGDPLAHLAETRGVGIEATAADATVAEGGTAKVTVSLNSPAGIDLPLQYSTSDGTATAGADYTASSGTVTIPAGQTSATIEVPTIGNETTQPDRDFTVTLSGPPAWARLADASATVTIRDDDAAPVVSIAGPAAAVGEGDMGGRDAMFTIRLDHPSAAATTVDWATVDGSAQAPADYLPAHGSVAFAPGETTATIPVVVNGDLTMEPDESFGVALSDPQGLTLGAASAQATIDDDEPVVVTAGGSSVVSPVEGSAQVPFTIGAGALLSGESVTVAWQAVAGTAQVPGDVSGSGTVTLTHDQPSVTVEATVSAADGAARPHTLFYRLELGSASSSAGRSVLARDGSGEITPAPVVLPTVKISGPETVAEGSPLTLTAVGAEGKPPYVYGWDLDGDGSYDDASGASVTHTFASFGTAAIGVQVTDSAGLTATATQQVEVTDVAPSVAKLPDAKLVRGGTLRVSGSFADPGADTWTGTVDYGTGVGPVTLPLSGKSFALAHAYPDTGSYAVTVRVCDDGTLCGSTAFTVTVSPPAPPPTVSISGPDSVPEGSSLSLSASAAKGTPPFRFAWDLDGDGGYDDATGATVSQTFASFGAATVAVRVTDSAGKTATATHVVTVSDVAPSVGALPDQRLTAGDTLHLSGSFTDPGADDWTATVDYGAGPQPLTLAGRSFSLEHAFADPGSYRVTVAVCDDGKLCGSSSFTVAVAAPTRLAAAGAAKVDVAQQDKQGRYYHFINVAATLTSGTGPLAGQTVVFSANGGTICTATTADDGTAACPDDTKVDIGSFGDDVPTSYTASFAGSGDLAGSTVTAPLREIGPKR